MRGIFRQMLRLGAVSSSCSAAVVSSHRFIFLMSIRTFRSLLSTLALGVVLALSGRAADENRKAYDLPAGEAAVALKRFAEVSGRETLFAADAIRGVRTAAVRDGDEYVIKAKALGLRAEMYAATDMPHGFFNKEPWIQVTAKQMDMFLASLGYLGGEPTIQLPEKAPALVKE